MFFVFFRLEAFPWLARAEEMLDFAKAMEVNSDSAEGQGSMGYQHEDTGILLLGWLRNPAPVENGGLFIPLFHPIICLGSFNHPFAGVAFCNHPQHHRNLWIFMEHNMT